MAAEQRSGHAESSSPSLREGAIVDLGRAARWAAFLEVCHGRTVAPYYGQRRLRTHYVGGTEVDSSLRYHPGFAIEDILTVASDDLCSGPRRRQPSERLGTYGNGAF